MAGSRPGEHRGGRQKGTPNKATAEIKSLARKHGKEAIDKLVSLMRSAENEQVQGNAAKDLLDRGYGKPAQAMAGPDGEGPVKAIIEWAASSE